MPRWIFDFSLHPPRPHSLSFSYYFRGTEGKLVSKLCELGVKDLQSPVRFSSNWPL